jgi:hypothetical protein
VEQFTALMQNITSEIVALQKSGQADRILWVTTTPVPTVNQVPPHFRRSSLPSSLTHPMAVRRFWMNPVFVDVAALAHSTYPCIRISLPPPTHFRVCLRLYHDDHDRCLCTTKRRAIARRLA